MNIASALFETTYYSHLNYATRHHLWDGFKLYRTFGPTLKVCWVTLSSKSLVVAQIWATTCALCPHMVIGALYGAKPQQYEHRHITL